MKLYTVLENCHYQGVTYRQGQTVKLADDPQWPERFKETPGKAATDAAAVGEPASRTDGDSSAAAAAAETGTTAAAQAQAKAATKAKK